MNALNLALRLLRRDWRAGELRVLMLALVIAVGSVTSVGFFTDRVNRALVRQAGFLIGGDLALASDHPPAAAFEQEAQRRGLAHNGILSFPSMVQGGRRIQLADIRAVSQGYPLRGKVEADGRETRAIPPPGAVWLAPRLMRQLGLKPGDALTVGERQLTVAAALTREPDQAGSLFNIAPRLLMNRADLPATGLLQVGSRVTYRLSLAGDENAVAAYRAWATPRLARGERLESVADARPEIRAALTRAERFLGLAALTSLVLAAVVIALAARRFLERHLDGCAVMRCLGASQGLILRLYLAQFLLLGLTANLAGCALGYAAQHLLAQRLGHLLAMELPTVSALPALQGMAAGMAVLLAFILPPLLQLKKTPALRVLRREIGLSNNSSLAALLLGVAALAALVVAQAGDAKLGAIILAGLALTAAAAAGLAYGLTRLLATLRGGSGGWRIGLANLHRRTGGSVVQAAAFGVGLMVMLLLTVVRGDLLESWQAALPLDAPNRFVINIQPDQVAPLQDFFRQHGMAGAALFPMVRARLTAIGDKPVGAADYPDDDRAQRLIEREFNLSWAQMKPTDNRVVAGKWWSQDKPAPQLSIEEGIAKTLGIRLGDVLTFEVVGAPFHAPVTSLRKVDWDSFRVNFFVIAAPGLLEDFPASHITSFYLPAGREALLDEMVRAFPNLTVVDVAAVMNEVRRIMAQLAGALTFVFLFTWAMGFVILFAAIAATNDERVREAALMRALGANRRTIRASQFAEFAGIGLVAGSVAALGASGLEWRLSAGIFHLPYAFNAWLLLAPPVAALLVGAAGLVGCRRSLNHPPLAVLRE
ncbi:MAG: FtsX-like permease family protein [Sulfuricellaceae bacterium]